MVKDIDHEQRAFRLVWWIGMDCKMRYPRLTAAAMWPLKLSHRLSHRFRHRPKGTR